MNDEEFRKTRISRGVKQATQDYDLIVYIGRFQPPHLAHIELMKMALERGKELLVLIGSAFQPRTTRNPWSWQERADMIKQSLPDTARVRCLPLRDVMYNDQQWVLNVQNSVEEVQNMIGADPNRIAIIGHSKDETSYYLQMFPQYHSIDVGNIDDIHAADIRAAFWMMFPEDFDDKIGTKLPPAIHNSLKAFTMRNEYEQLVREYKFLLKYWEAWSGLPHPVQFITVDAVVVQSGHILLVRRRAEPGRGLWALPGGFLNPNERIETAVIRELYEETRIDCPKPVLLGSIRDRQVYDHPNRSLRGRTVTHANLIELRPGPLHKVKGDDDAEKARWVPLGVFQNMEEVLFEDHFHIVNDMVGKL